MCFRALKPVMEVGGVTGSEERINIRMQGDNQVR